MPYTGYATYRVRLTLPQDGMYSLLIDNIYTSFRLYVDGVLMAEVGKFGTTAQTSSPRFTDTVVPFQVHGQQADLMFQVANFSHPYAGIGVAPILGKTNDIIYLITMSHISTVLLVGILVSATLFILYFYHSTNKDRSILYFATVCLLFAIRMLASNSTLSLVLPNLSATVISKIEYFTVPLIAITFLLYSRHAFPRIIPRTIENIVIVLSTAYVILVLSFRVIIYNPVFKWYFAILMLVFLYWIIMMAIAVLKYKTVPKVMLFGCGILILTIIHQNFLYLFNSQNLFGNKIVGLGTTFFIFTHFHLFSLKFVKAFEVAQQTSHDLETKVESRTRELHALNEQLKVMATTDSLTNLYNRNELYQQMHDRTIEYNQHLGSEQKPFAVVYIDIDNFKLFNDLYSHKAGDVVLQQFARLLNWQCESNDVLFRFGGDEFIVFLCDTDDGQAIGFAQDFINQLSLFSCTFEQELFTQLNLSVHIPQDIQIACSLGIAVHSKGPIDIDRLVQNADRALLTAKSMGKNRYHLISDIGQG